ncbi:MAG: hypothetical protein KF757_03270 [Phycisphaeraceae bacterium]|nr:hypothetical protein [Phycisphaeraceae bacterium]MCW5763025.1 hypothetical protein [Phycisphaeraceae bacterium]
MLARLKDGEASVPPLLIRWTAGTGPRGGEADVTAEVRWEGREFRFVAELKGRSTPRTFVNAVAQSREYAARAGRYPMIVLPYLAPERLDELAGLGVSGIDLCGNGIVTVPGELFVLRSGSPNKYRESYPIRAVYRGATSLVARALLLRPVSESLSDLDGFIRSRGGAITLTTISKALRRMEDDVLIERKGGWARLLQPEGLLDKLVASYEAPKLRKTFIGSTTLDRAALGDKLSQLESRAVFTGQSSTERYAVMGREDRLRVYCESTSELVEMLGADAKPGERFANLELYETVEPTVYFDARLDGRTPFASPIQAYIELATGDKREQDVSKQIRSLILREAGQIEGGSDGDE